MQIRNKVIFIILSILNFSLFYSNLSADEFNISAIEITVDKENNIVVGKGSVEVTDSDGRVINANKIIYEKSREFLQAIGSVKMTDTGGSILNSDKATYDKMNEIFISYENSELILEEGYNLKSEKISYAIDEEVIGSDRDSVFTDIDGNIVNVSMFQYQIKKNLFSSAGNIKVVDIHNNKYFFKEIHVDTKKHEMIGTDVSVLLDQENFGVKKENDPRFVANDIFISKNKSDLSKAIFTVCKKRDEGKCPPWSLQAKKISHDKTKKTIYYDHAILKVYDIPIFYAPKFFHPDPTVKRQSGFLPPFFTDSTTVGTGFGLPYYWAISQDKDLTFTTKTYANENILLLNEYRQAFRNGFLTIDTSYTDGYKETSSTKTPGSRSHLFANLDFDFSKDSYNSNLNFKVQRVSNDTYFRIHDINTALVDAENTTLENKISYNYNKDNMYLDISATMYENLRKKTKDRYEHILPNIIYGKTFFTEKFGTLDFKSNALYKNYDANKHTSIFTNDVLWSPGSKITKLGFVNRMEGLIRNTNYEAKNTNDYKTASTVNELTGVLSYKSSLPMEKKDLNTSKIFSPNFMVRYAPGHMKNLNGEDVSLNYANLYSLNKTSEIESGLSAILGLDFKTSKKNEEGENEEKLSASVGQVFNYEKNEKLPSKTSLDQHMSDVVGEINYNFSEIGKIDYKFSLDHDFNTLNSNEVSTSLNFGKVAFNIDYLEQRGHVGKEHYVNSGVSLNFNEKNKLSFSTKKNFKTNSTEMYDISYQYEIDCLKAGLVFRREFYEDSDLEEKDSLMFVITFVPFTGVRTPVLSP